MMAPKGQELCCDIASELPTMVTEDAGRLPQVVLNLVSNAVKFTEKGNVTVRARSLGTSDGIIQLRVEVSDTGIGISEEGKTRLFQLFSQVDASTIRRFGGTGLGLALCRRLVDLFGGDIDVESRPGKGSTFWFTANLAPAEQSDPPVPIPATIQTMRTLVVTCSEANRHITSSILKNWGLRTTTCDDAASALTELAAANNLGERYGLAILDTSMRTESGADLVEHIRSVPEFSNLKLIVLTSVGESHLEPETQAIDACHYLTKPIRRSKLLETLLQAISGNSLEPSDAPRAPVGLGNEASLGNGYQLLIAEDNEVNQVVIREILTRMGFQCTLVGNGRLALEKAETRAFDLVLMDCQMPELDGLTATSEIRVREADEGGWRRSGGRLPVVALTANAVRGDREACLEAGMDDYLTKPINRQALIATLGRWLKLGETPPRIKKPTEGPVAGTDLANAPPLDPCFDESDLLERCFGDRQLATELLGMLEESVAGHLDSMAVAVVQEDRDGLVRIAHTLKGVAGNLSATELTKLATSINQQYRGESADLASLLSDISTMRLEMTRCLSAIPDVRQKLSAQAARSM